MVATITVEDEHFAFLRLQKGALSPVEHDREAWHMAYQQALTKDFKYMRPHLPQNCGSILDVGSGLGGINILLTRFYGTQTQVTLLDGEDTPPQMVRHNVPFNSMRVAQDFLVKNGVEHFSYYPHDLRGAVPRKFDLIISLGSWCFHYAPSVYLGFVQQCTRPGTVIILDVRKGKPEWVAQLREAFGPAVSIIHNSKKFDRVIFHAKD